uniref:Larval cuticle protein LCP-17 n=1 Tax=Megaselia scalaris TaxID=36166 RepID=T1GES4_MEGSC
MIKLIVVLAFIGFLAAGPTQTTTKPSSIAILETSRKHDEDGSWNFSFKSSDGHTREEKSVVTDPGSKDEEKKFSISGSYKYIDANGKEVEVHYTADENGFVPIGTGIPESISNAAKGIDVYKH